MAAAAEARMKALQAAANQQRLWLVLLGCLAGPVAGFGGCFMAGCAAAGIPACCGACVWLAGRGEGVWCGN